MPHPYRLADTTDLFTPSLVFYPQFIRQNVARIVELAGAARLRPHVKTHKCAEVVKIQLAAGVTKHKAATIAEAEVLAAAGAGDVLLAYPVVGPTGRRLADLAKKYPGTVFSGLVDHAVSVETLANAAKAAGVPMGFFLDVDVGQHRTGIAAGPAAADLYAAATKAGLTPRGLHAYDGHNHQPSRADRESSARAGLAPVLELRQTLAKMGLPADAIVAGGTPTFPVFASIRDVPGLECSPGTYVLHDAGYGSHYPDLDGLTPAAVIVTRVVSRPTADRVTFDVGNKAIAADPLLANRVKLLDVPEYTVVGHNEEHLIIQTAHADRFTPGDVHYALPGHVCPTCALHREAVIAADGKVVGRWAITARDRVLSV